MQRFAYFKKSPWSPISNVQRPAWNSWKRDTHEASLRDKDVFSRYATMSNTFRDARERERKNNNVADRRAHVEHGHHSRGEREREREKERERERNRERRREFNDEDSLWAGSTPNLQLAHQRTRVLIVNRVRVFHQKQYSPQTHTNLLVCSRL